MSCSNEFDMERKGMEIKRVATALSEFEKASRAAMMAIQQVGTALESLCATFVSLTNNEDISRDTTEMMQRAHMRMREFKDGSAFRDYNQQFHAYVKQEVAELAQLRKAAEQCSKERKETKQKYTKYANNSSSSIDLTKRDQYYTNWQSSEGKFLSEYKRLISRQDTAMPKVLTCTLDSSAIFLNRLQETLRDISDATHARQLARAYSANQMQGNHSSSGGGGGGGNGGVRHPNYISPPQNAFTPNTIPLQQQQQQYQPFPSPPAGLYATPVGNGAGPGGDAIYGVPLRPDQLPHSQLDRIPSALPL